MPETSDVDGPRPSASEKHMFRGKSRAHGREHAEISLREFSAFEEAFQDKEYRYARHIAAVAQHIPARGESARFQSEHILEGVKDFGAAGMEHEMFEFAEVET